MAGARVGSMNCTPQATASTAGASPKLMTSARESISRPNSEVVPVRRAIPPSSPSVKTATPMAIAATENCWPAPGSPEAACMAPRNVFRMERYPRKMFPAVKSVGNAYAARLGLRSGERGSTNRSLMGMRLRVAGYDSPCDHAGAGCHARAWPYQDFPFRPEQDIYPRSELD